MSSLVVLTLVLAAGAAPADPSAPPVARLVFSDFAKRMAEANLGLAAQRLNVPIAEAQIAIARVFPDAQLTVGVSQYDVTHAGNPTALQVSVQVPLQVGGQRGARIEAAQASLSVAAAELEEYLRQLRGAAADAWIDAVLARLSRERKRQTLASLERLVLVNELRLKAGDIGEVAMIQSRVEAQQSRAAVLEADGRVRVADLALLQFLGRDGAALRDRPLDLAGELEFAADRVFDVGALLAAAHRQRPDALAARRRLEAARRQLALAQANRIVDVNFGLGWQHYFPVMNSPPAELLTATVTVPLPFSRIYRGELVAAEQSITQADLDSAAIDVQLETDVRQAVTRFEASAAQVRLYRTILTDADKVLEKTLYNYQRGGATLVEVLVAQRTVNDVYLAFYDALASTAHALVAVQLSAGDWDVDFR